MQLPGAMSLDAVHDAPHLRSLLQIWDDESILQNSRCVDDALDTHSSLRESQSCCRRDVLDPDPQLLHLLCQFASSLLDGTKLCRSTSSAVHPCFKLGDEVDHFIFPISHFLRIFHCHIGTELHLFTRLLRNVDNLLLDALQGFKGRPYQFIGHGLELSAGCSDDAAQRYRRLCQETWTAESLDGVQNDRTIRAVSLHHVMRTCSLHCCHQLLQRRWHACGAPTPRCRDHMVLPSYGKLVRCEHAQPSQATRNQSHPAAKSLGLEPAAL
mmetsp:Transcript_125396/g.297727  ORF Transcript_125396/g.297727 Transcript_125396/m.297727 type:complete len:269 (+) Transcript_125396:100-906(+)